MLTSPFGDCSTLEAAGVLPKQAWNLEDFVDTRVAKLV